MKNKKIEKVDIVDFNKTYLVPLAPIDKMRNEESPQEVNLIRDSKGDVIVRKDGFHSKFFYDFYFKYLIDINYIKECK